MCNRCSCKVKIKCENYLGAQTSFAVMKIRETSVEVQQMFCTFEDEYSLKTITYFISIL